MKERKAILRIESKVSSKTGNPYEIIAVCVELPNSEVVKLTELYVDNNLANALKLLDLVEKSSK